jgi:hypothetical protein
VLFAADSLQKQQTRGGVAGGAASPANSGELSLGQDIVEAQR